MRSQIAIAFTVAAGTTLLTPASARAGVMLERGDAGNLPPRRLAFRFDSLRPDCAPVYGPSADLFAIRVADPPPIQGFGSTPSAPPTFLIDSLRLGAAGNDGDSPFGPGWLMTTGIPLRTLATGEYWDCVPRTMESPLFGNDRDYLECLLEGDDLTGGFDVFEIKLTGDEFGGAASPEPGGLMLLALGAGLALPWISRHLPLGPGA